MVHLIFFNLAKQLQCFWVLLRMYPGFTQFIYFFSYGEIAIQKQVFQFHPSCSIWISDSFFSFLWSYNNASPHWFSYILLVALKDGAYCISGIDKYVTLRTSSHCLCGTWFSLTSSTEKGDGVKHTCTDWFLLFLIFI